MNLSYSLSEIATIVNGKLRSRNDFASITDLAIDSRKITHPAQTLFFALKGASLDGHHYIAELQQKGVVNFIISNENAIIENANFIIVNDVKTALQKLAAFHRKQFSYPVIGITGSNGKTIVKEWLYQLLHEKYSIVKNPKSYNSQIGVPLSVWQMSDAYNLGIFEAGISESGEMEKLEPIIAPAIGVFTNLGEAHSEGFINAGHKAKEKLKLFSHSEKIIYCKDHGEINNAIAAMVHLSKQNQQNKALEVFSWSQYVDADVKITAVLQQKNKSYISCSYQQKEIDFEIPFTDNASIENAMHCLCVMLLFKISTREIKKRMALLSRIEMRLELKDGINNCIVINDAYNSDSASIKIALDFLQQQNTTLQKTVILSDILQSGKNEIDLYGDVAALLESAGVTTLYAVGQAISRQKKQFEKIKTLHTEFFQSTTTFLAEMNTTRFSNELILIKGARKFEFERIVKFLEKKSHNTKLEINLSALANNLKVYQSLLRPETKMMAMVKAFGYGSGSIEIAKTLQFNRVNYLAVAYADEGVELRKAGITLPIMVMNADEDNYENIFSYQLEPEIYSLLQLQEMVAVFLSKPRKQQFFNIHIELETGMNRLGFHTTDIDKLIAYIQQNGAVKIASVFSHLAGSEDPTLDEFTHQQLSLFEKNSHTIIASFDYPIIRHILNSNGIVRHPQAQYDMVRLGIGMYGIDDSQQLQKRLQVVSTLKSSISQIKQIEKGETIGYNRKGLAHDKMTIATINIGYADGLPRILGNGNGYMLLKGKKAPIIGNVCMDMTMIDISGIADVSQADEVIIFGEKPTVSEVAKQANTIAYEILTGISSRVKRIYFQE